MTFVIDDNITKYHRDGSLDLEKGTSLEAATISCQWWIANETKLNRQANERQADALERIATALENIRDNTGRR